MIGSELLCLKCRSVGHIARSCPCKTWLPELDWFFSEERKAFNVDWAWKASTQDLCSGCQKINLLTLLESRPAWHTQGQLQDAYNARHQLIKSLGRVETISFWHGCSMCCCLFALTPNPCSLEQEVVLVPDWTVLRITGEVPIKLDEPRQRNYATTLLAVLRPSTLDSLTFSVRAHRGDALAMHESDLQIERTLGSRQICQSRFDAEIIGRWLSACQSRHGGSCAPVWTEQLEHIRLIDVQSRKIVPHPGHKFDYLTLSYVWGDQKQPSFKEGDYCESLPQTLEDAIIVVKALGKRYLWVDSVCINQSDREHKNNQIDRMWSIYRGSYLTIIALSSTSANTGLARINGPSTFPQLTCFSGGKRLVTLMPTLSQQIWKQKWGRRGWTFQEALLSPRCLYISDHQVYFDCEAMQCSESLDETRSWAHGLTDSSNPTDEGFVTWMMSQIGSGAFRNALDSRSMRLQHWGYKVNLYSPRRLTYAEDGLRALDGVLQRLGTMYPRGFFWGLPIEDLDWALLWRPQIPSPRRQNFPSWSWAGWEGGAWYIAPQDLAQIRVWPLDLTISKMSGGQAEILFRSETRSVNDGVGLMMNEHPDPIDETVSTSTNEVILSPDEHQNAEIRGYLLVDAVCLHFAPDFAQPRFKVHSASQPELFLFHLHGVPCRLLLQSTDREIHESRKKEKTFILLARERQGDYVLYHLLLVHFQSAGCSASRGTSVALIVPAKRRWDVLKELSLRKERILLT